MELTFYKNNVVNNEQGESVLLWKFKDQDGNLWNTETPLDGTEEDAASIILGSIQIA